MNLKDTNDRKVLSISKKKYEKIKDVARDSENIISMRDKFQHHMDVENNAGKRANQIFAEYDRFINPLLFT